MFAQYKGKDFSARRQEKRIDSVRKSSYSDRIKKNRPASEFMKDIVELTYIDYSASQQTGKSYLKVLQYVLR